MIREKFNSNETEEGLRPKAATNYKPRPSFQPTVYELMNEIPDYLDKRYSDDSLLEAKRPPKQTHQTSKSVEKRKTHASRKISISIRKKSVDTDSQIFKDMLFDEFSLHENTISQFQAFLKVINENSSNYLQGRVLLTEYRIKFNPDDMNSELDYSKDYYYVPIYLIKRYFNLI